MGVVCEQHGAWVEETTFGVWFLNTGIWVDHVLAVALNDVERLMQPREMYCATVTRL